MLEDGDVCFFICSDTWGDTVINIQHTDTHGAHVQFCRAGQFPLWYVLVFGNFWSKISLELTTNRFLYQFICDCKDGPNYTRHLSFRQWPTAWMPSCMYVSPAGLISLSSFKPSSILDLHRMTQSKFSVWSSCQYFNVDYQWEGRGGRGGWIRRDTRRVRFHKGRMVQYLSPVSGRITTALAEKTM